MGRLKTAREIIEEATDAQIERWYKDICDGKWPARMPVPVEATEAVWIRLHTRAINMPAKVKK